MTATVSDISAAIGQTISANCQNPSGGQIRYLTELTDTFTPPIVLVAIKEVEYHAAFARGNVPHTYDVMLILGRAADRAALAAMEAYMSASGAASVALAVETVDASGNPSLGGVVQSCVCVKSGPPGSVKFQGSEAVYISVPFEVKVIA